MSALPGPAYHFRTKEQRKRLHVTSLPDRLVIDPATGSDMGAAGHCRVDRLAVRSPDEMFWVDEAGQLFAGGVAGPRAGETERIVIGRDRLWLLAGDRLVQLDLATLHLLIERPARLDSDEAPRVVDIAPDGKDGLWLLAGDRLGRIDSRGSLAKEVRALGDRYDQIAAGENALALLAGGRRLALFSPPLGALMPLDLDHDHLGGAAWTGEEAVLAGAGDGFLVTGIVEPEGVRQAGLMLIGADGTLRADATWRDGSTPRLLVSAGPDLFGLFDEAGVQRVRRFAGFARRGGQRILTPALETASPAGTWHRAEVEARLPEGATLTLRWAASDDEGDRRIADAILGERRPMCERLERIDELLFSTRPAPREFTYVGERRDGEAPVERFAFPLHEASGPILWLDLSLRRNAAPAEPGFVSLVVLHEAESLMDHLPAIYRGTGDGDGTLRRLVGVIEATTQEVDRKIGELADRLDPARAPEAWLPDLVAMLGLPDHESLSARMRRNLLGAAAAILARRGTREGLHAMLAALFPDRPIRIVDRTAQSVQLMVGGSGVSGGMLPALLSGPSDRVPKLNARLVLNRTGLCPANACTDASIRPVSEVLASVPVTGGERRRYAGAVQWLAEAMVPAGVRLRIRWTAWRRRRGKLPDDILTAVGAPEPLRFGDGQALGAAHVGGRRDARLDPDGTTPVPHRLL